MTNYEMTQSYIFREVALTTWNIKPSCLLDDVSKFRNEMYSLLWTEVTVKLGILMPVFTFNNRYNTLPIKPKLNSM